MQLRGWQKTAAAVAGVLLAIVFFVSGSWKVLEPFQTGELLEQAQVPAGYGTLGAATLGTIELLTAFLLFVPRYRRWGGLLGSALLIFFMGWIGFYYSELAGQECSCFPLIKRSVGPGFFVGDGIMLALGVVASLWSTPVRRFRVPGMAFAALAVLAAVSIGVHAQQRSNVQLPGPVMVDGKPENLATGKVFLFFYDPMCSHCAAAAKFMSTMNWKGTRLVTLPTNVPQFAQEFLQDAGLHASTSPEAAKLREKFKFVDPPFGVALVDGQVKKTFPQTQFNAPLPEAELRKLGFIH